MRSTQTPVNSSLACGYKFDTASHPVGADVAVTPGSLSVCLKCGAVAKFANDLRVIPLTDKEAQEIASSPETMRELRKLVSAIHFVQEQHRRRN